MDPHAPIHPATADAVGQLGQTFRSLLANACQSGNINSAYYEKLYDYSLMYVDTQLNRIIDQLKDWSIWDETALVITGDHGEALYDRGLYGHPSHYLYNELLHVPLLTRVPGFEGERLYRPFSLGWLHELMADVAGINRAELPLTSSINDHRQSDAEVAAQPVVVSDSISKNGRTIAVQSRDVKIVKTELSPEDEEFNMSHQNAVYNISTDPLERHRLSISKAPQYLETTIEKHEQSDNFPKPLDGYMSDEVQDKLRDLGYL
jgi:choline-sulfatase